MLDGTMAVVPRARFGVVDVRDVADLHVRAMTTPDAAGNRFLAVSNDPATSFLELAQLLHDNLGATTPTEEASGPDLPRPTIHNNRARTMLGWHPRPLETTILETARSLRDLALLPPGIL
ncbi:hypothetical protein [Kribbella sp. NPDC004536]|uniref:hypothetical protein n=1 Tax=Kribbella sp. NPDC004536 TaxID=3364106 RepID=UPI00368C039C